MHILGVFLFAMRYDAGAFSTCTSTATTSSHIISSTFAMYFSTSPPSTQLAMHALAHTAI